MSVSKRYFFYSCDFGAEATFISLNIYAYSPEHAIASLAVIMKKLTGIMIELAPRELSEDEQQIRHYLNDLKPKFYMERPGCGIFNEHWSPDKKLPKAKISVTAGGLTYEHTLANPCPKESSVKLYLDEGYQLLESARFPRIEIEVTNGEEGTIYHLRTP